MAAGIIVEFNPLHNGHMEHLHETRRLTQREQIIAVMSGNFVQRGEPAICDKWRRTKMALLAGVDIVIELPVGYVLSGADYFARASVGLLAATGVVDSLCFGSESGELAQIIEAGRVLSQEPEEYQIALRRNLANGLSFAAARGDALKGMLNDTPPDLFTKPNNGLGIEYCKALWQINWPMEVSTSYRATGGPSATAIRKMIWDKQPESRASKRALDTSLLNTMGDNQLDLTAKFLPSHVIEILNDVINANEIVKLDNFSTIFRHQILSTQPNMGEGLENRFRYFANRHNTLTEILDAVKTKRYTYTRLQRAAIRLVLGVEQNHIDKLQYIRVLGFRKDAAKLLGEMTRRASLPVITTGQAMDQLKGAASAMLVKEFEAADIYRLAYNKVRNYKHEREIPIVTV